MKLAEFVNLLYPVIVRIAPEYGIRCPQAVMCQAIVESWKGNGISYLAKLNNFFGLKCGSSWKGKSVNLKTKEEYTPGTLTTIKDNFRVWDTVEEGIHGYFNFISTKRYSNLQGVTDPTEYLQRIKSDGYATSSTYVAACLSKLKYVPVDWTNGKSNLDGIAQEVIAGIWGNGEYRRKKLALAGYDAQRVQARVNEIIRGSS